MDNVIKLRTLESQPEEMILSILSHLEPKSLVNICTASKKMRRICHDLWKQFFQRDVTKQRICSNPNWQKLYRLAMTHKVGVYSVSLYDEDDDIRFMMPSVNIYVIGEENLKMSIGEILVDELDMDEDEIDDFFNENKISGDSEYDVEDNIITTEKAGLIPLKSILALPLKKEAIYEMKMGIDYESVTLVAVGVKDLKDVLTENLTELGILESSIEDLLEDLDEALSLGEESFDFDVEHEKVKIVKVGDFQTDQMKRIRKSVCKMK